MITQIEIENYLTFLESTLMNEERWMSIDFTKRWIKDIPKQAGVYMIREDVHIIYVGETGNLKKRMNDFCDSRHHTLRRTLGKKHFSQLPHFKYASSKEKFPEEIEILLNEYIQKKIKISFIVVELGRKELEEFIECKLNADCKLNKRGKRK